MSWTAPKKKQRPLKLFVTSLIGTIFTYLILHFSFFHVSPAAAPLSPLTFLRPVSKPLAGGAAAAPDLLGLPKREQGWLGPTKKSASENSKRAIAAGEREPAPIRITSSLPSTHDLAPSSPLLLAWTSALQSLSSAARHSTTARAKLVGTIKGIPGTGIASEVEARALQEQLDCRSGNGEWIYDALGKEQAETGGAGLTVHKHDGVYASCDKRFYKSKPADADSTSTSPNEGTWAVRESLKWRWVPSPSCSRAEPASPPPPPLSRRALCTLMAHKSTLLVGDKPQYALHDLVLDWATTAPQSCYGDLYCKEHALCGEVLRSAGVDGEGAGAVERWEGDQRVFHRLPLPPAPPNEDAGVEAAAAGRAVQRDEPEPVAKRQLDKSTRSTTYGTLLRYRRSDGLRSASAQTVANYLHPSTGILEVNQPWLADARRSDVVVLTKSPIPFPATGHNATWDAWIAQGVGEKEASRIVEAAWRITEEVWLPEMMETLRAIRAPPSPPDSLVVYRGNWRAHGDCGASTYDGIGEGGGSEDELWDWVSPGDGPPPHRQQPTLSQLVYRSKADKRLTNLHTLFYNIQTILQNHVLRTEILPAFGIPFLDLETPLSVWRSGMLGGSASAPFSAVAPLVDQSTPHGGLGVGLRTSASGDCTRYCIPSPGMAIEEAFLGGLLQVFQRGWNGSRERKDRWVGEGFVNVRERARLREEEEEDI